MTELDPNSFANTHELITRKLHLDLEADFSSSTLKGHVIINTEALRDGVDELVLDTRDLTLFQVTDADSGEKLQYEVREPEEKNKVLGKPLHIKLNRPAKKGDTVRVRVDYETSPSASGIQFVPPSQTCGKKHPYLFTQFQAIHARSGIPHQDTPVAKMTYTANLTVPKPLRALMSALDAGQEDLSDKTKYSFSLEVPIASYLIAFAVGDLHSKRIGPRSCVWTEREQLEASAWEFESTEDFIKMGEALCGPYIWGKLDLLILPPSFPLGGMENPTLTFVTPTLLTGDRSLVDTVAHEVAHSWTGNMVTNRSWGHFWLNEGFNTFLERKILQKMGGERGDQIRDLQSIIGMEFLTASVELFGYDHEYTKLIIDMSGEDPDDCYSKVAYEKGYNFLYYLEGLVGGPVFEAWFRKYIEDFTNKTLLSDDFKKHFIDYMEEHGHGDKIKDIDWHEWFYGTGLGPVRNSFDTTLADAARNLSKRWQEAKDDEVGTSFSPDDVKTFDSAQFSIFLADLKNGTPYSHAKLDAMDKHYKLTPRQNGEIALWWFQICLDSGYDKVFDAAVKFLLSNGRMKYVRPIYRALYNCGPAGKALAQKTFSENRSFYNNICAKGLVQDVHMG